MNNHQILGLVVITAYFFTLLGMALSSSQTDIHISNNNLLIQCSRTLEKTTEGWGNTLRLLQESNRLMK